MAKTVENYIDERLFDNAKTEDDLPKTNALVWFNRWLHKLEESIAWFINENFYDNNVELDLVSWTKKYELPTGDSDASDVVGIPEFKKLLEVSLNYDGVWTGNKAIEMTDFNNWEPETYYDTKQPKSSPRYMFEWRYNIKIYPTPTVNVTSWMKIRYARTDADVTLATSESALSLPRQYIPSILEYMTFQLAKTNKDWDVQYYELEWEKAREEVLTFIGNRYAQPVTYRNPNLSNMMWNWNWRDDMWMGD